MKRMIYGLIAMTYTACLLMIVIIVTKEWPVQPSVKISGLQKVERKLPWEQLEERYQKVIHRMWIDNPIYVENILSKTQEFKNLNSVVQDWGNVFVLQNAEDSALYDWNKTGKNTPDIPAAKAKRDRGNNPCPEIRIPKSE